jgi:hypothetical protein
MTTTQDPTWTQLTQLWRQLHPDEQAALVQCAELLLERGGPSPKAAHLATCREHLLGHLDLVAQARASPDHVFERAMPRGNYQGTGQ